MINNPLNSTNNPTALLLLAFSLLTPWSSSAHPYFPFEKGLKRTLDYHFYVEGGKLPQSEMRGTIIITALGEEDLSAKGYSKWRTTYEGIPSMTAPVDLFRREENGAVYMRFEHQGKWKETIELPASVDLGTEWEYFDGVRSTRKVTNKLAVSSSSGKEYKDCIEVTRTALDNPKLKDVKNIAYYCRGVGDVVTIFSMPSPLGAYVTKTRIRDDL